jgi:cell division protein ZapA
MELTPRARLANETPGVSNGPRTLSGHLPMSLPSRDTVAQVKRSVTVQVAGQRYTLKTDDDDRLVKALAAYVDAKFRDVQKSSRSPDTQAVAILTALQVAEELFQTREEAADFKKRVHEKTLTLLDYLAKVGRV